MAAKGTNSITPLTIPCLCGEPLRKTTAWKSYSLGNGVICDLCRKKCRNDDVVFIARLDQRVNYMNMVMICVNHAAYQDWKLI